LVRSLEQCHSYQGLYQELRGYLGKPRKTQTSKPPVGELTFARYGLWHYVNLAKQHQEPYASLHRAGANLHGLIRILLFKRFESSVYAFQQTVERLLRIHEFFGKALEQGIVPAGEEAQSILYEADEQEETQILDQLRNVAQRYEAADFDLESLGEHIKHDVDLLKKMQQLVKPIKPEQDAKLLRLKNLLSGQAFKDSKILIFTQYADTAQYLYENLKEGGNRMDIEVVNSNNRDKMRIVGRFAPRANPEFAFQSGEQELNTLVATDVLAEGLNLQDCDRIVNYDLHWNPVRLIQRFGRIDRIGTEHQVIYGFNFLPETGIDRHLGLRAKLSNRIQEIHDTIGEDAAILDHGERLNEEAMYDIYEQQGNWPGEEDEFGVLDEAEETLQRLRSQDPGEFQRIAALRDGIRAGKGADHSGTFVFCQAGQYQQLFLLDGNGQIISRDIPRILGMIKCSQEEPGKPLPPGHNKAVMAVKRLFTEEVKHREAERKYTLSQTLGQRYIMREMRIHFGAVEDEETKSQINRMEQVFRGSMTAAVIGELNRLRRNGVTGQDLLKGLKILYHQHHLQEWLDRRVLQLEEESIPRVICSEALG
jgi:Helicase conserved C-terminal domain